MPTLLLIAIGPGRVGRGGSLALFVFAAAAARHPCWPTVPACGVNPAHMRGEPGQSAVCTPIGTNATGGLVVVVVVVAILAAQPERRANRLV